MRKDRKLLKVVHATGVNASLSYLESGILLTFEITKIPFC